METRVPPRDALLSLRRVASAIVCAGLAGCATLGAPPVSPPPSAPAPARPLPRNAEPPPPRVNLSGFPLAYRQGYADGCASATGSERRDADRFSRDTDYSMGWQDGIALCRRR